LFFLTVVHLIDTNIARVSIFSTVMTITTTYPSFLLPDVYIVFSSDRELLFSFLRTLILGQIPSSKVMFGLEYLFERLVNLLLYKILILILATKQISLCSSTITLSALIYEFYLWALLQKRSLYFSVSPLLQHSSSQVLKQLVDTSALFSRDLYDVNCILFS
jgi:hypothetical protein